MVLKSRISVTETVVVMSGSARCLCKDSPVRDEKSERRRRKMDCKHAEWSVATGGLLQKVCAIRRIIAGFPNHGHRTFLREEEDTIGLRC